MTERFFPAADEGLSDAQVKARTDAGLTNYIKRGGTKTVGRIVFTNTVTFFNMLCFAVAAVLVWVGIAADRGAFKDLIFLITVFLNTAIGIIQEIKAKLIIERLSVVSCSTAEVIRCYKKIEISVDDIVLDDVQVLGNGRQVSADSIVLDGTAEVNESLLTGESKPVHKTKGDLVLAGSFVAAGNCRVRVDKVGQDSYIQSLAKRVSSYTPPRSELLSSLRMLIKYLSVIMIVLCVLLVVRQLSLGTEDAGGAVRRTAGAVVGMIPSGMLLLTSFALAVGVINLAKSKTLVQDLYCIEMLARADTICFDKTGTITDGTMKVCEVVEIKTDGHPVNDIISGMIAALGETNQTAAALERHFGKNSRFECVDILPFSSERKLSAVTFRGEGTFILGAPEYVCEKDKDSPEITELLNRGYRVLALAHTDGSLKGDVLPEKPGLIAVIALCDSLRENAGNTIEWFKQNNVKVCVISGDNPVTASKTAQQAGICGAEKYISLEGMSESDVRQSAAEFTVFGRVSPEQKQILVNELRKQGKTVAMTGDGVNDILALKEADCSIAMASGAEAARNVSHLVLLDSNFASLPKVVTQGRRVIHNVQKSGSLYLFKTLFVMLLILFAVVAGTGYLFSPSNIIMLELLVIGLPSFFLALENNNSSIEGRYILNILKNALSGAAVILLNVCILFVFYRFALLGINWDSFVTLCIYTTTVTGIMMLYKIIRPLNIYRFSIFLGAAVLVCAAVFIPFTRGFIGLSGLLRENILLLIVILQATYPMISVARRILG